MVWRSISDQHDRAVPHRHRPLGKAQAGRHHSQFAHRPFSPAVAASLADPSPRKSRSVRISCCHGRHGDPIADALVLDRPTGPFRCCWRSVAPSACRRSPPCSRRPGTGCRWRSSPSAAIGVLAFRHIVAVCVAWLMIAGATLEMTLGDIVGPGAYQGTIAAVKAAELGLALLCILRYGLYPDVFNPGLGVRGDVHRRAGAWAASRPHADGQPALAAGIDGTLRICVQPAVARLGRDNGARHRLDPAGVRGRRRGASPCGPAPGIRRQLRCAPGRPRRTRGPRRLLPRRDLCLPDRALPGRTVALAAAAGDEFPDPGADRRALAARLCGCRDRPDTRLCPLRSVSAPAPHPDAAAGRLPAAAAGGPGPGAADGAAVPRMERRGRPTSAAAGCCGRHSSRRPRRRHGSVGGWARATRSSRRTARWRG